MTTSSAISTRSPGAEAEVALDRAARSVLAALGDDPAHAELASHLVGEDHAAGGGAGHGLRLETARRPGEAGADRGGAVRPLQQVELLDVAAGVAAGGELEVAVEEGAALLEGGDHRGVGRFFARHRDWLISTPLSTTGSSWPTMPKRPGGQ